jgi:hypothetical protein
MDQRDVEVLGAPPEKAKWWGIVRFSGEQEEACRASDDAGVMVDKWPLSELSIARVRELFGAGDFRVTWFRADDDGRPKVSGRGNKIGLQRTETPSPMSAHPPGSVGEIRAIYEDAERRAEARAEAMFERLGRLVGLGAQGAVPAASPDATLLKELQKARDDLTETRHEMERERERQRLEAKHRAELEEKDREIRRLQDAAEADDGPTFSPESPIVETVVYAAVNAVAKNPSAFFDNPVVQGLLGKALEKFMGAQALAAAPVVTVQNPAPAPAPTNGARVHDIPPQ